MAFHEPTPFVDGSIGKKSILPICSVLIIPEMTKENQKTNKLNKETK